MRCGVTVCMPFGIGLTLLIPLLLALAILGMAKKRHQVIPQVAKACGGDLGILLCFRENERALQHALYEISDALRIPSRLRRIAFFSGHEVASEFGDVLRKHPIAYRSQIWMSGVDLLNGRADQTGVKRNLTAHYRNPEIDIPQHAITRITFGLVRCGSEKCRGHSAKLLDRRNAELFFAVEVMEETTFRDASGRADVVNGAGRVAPGPYDVPGRFEQLGARF